MSFYSLALETSSRRNAVALCCDRLVVASVDSETYFQSTAKPDSVKPGPSSVLIPMIHHVLKQGLVEPQQLDLISVTRGPGMFTGLRVGVVTAKTLAFSIGCRVAAIDTLHAIAFQATQTHDLEPGRVVKVVINAQRGQVFAARFQVNDSQDCTPVGESRIVEPRQWVETLNGDEFLTGPGLQMIEPTLSTSVNTIPRFGGLEIERSHQRACSVSTIAELGHRKFDLDQTDDLWELSPVYFRPSAAEEVKRASRGV